MSFLLLELTSHRLLTGFSRAQFHELFSWSMLIKWRIVGRPWGQF